MRSHSGVAWVGALVGVLIVLLTDSASAQTVRASVLDSSTRGALAGATVQLLDSAGDPVRSTLTDSVGRFVIVAPSSAAYSLRVLRIGYAPALVAGIRPGAGAALDLPDVLMSTFAARLSPLLAVDRSGCPNRAPASVERLPQIWNEISNSLAASEVAQAFASYRFRTRLWQAELDSAGRRLSISSETAILDGAAPFFAQRPSVLVNSGFVRPADGGLLDYFAPSASFLSSDAFMGAWCFWLDDRQGSASSVVHYTPMPGRDAADVEGTMQLRSGVLTEVSFRYVGSRLPEEAKGASGAVTYSALPSGMLYPQRWQIRIPRIVLVHQGQRFVGTRVVGYREVGGEVLQVTPGGVRN